MEIPRGVRGGDHDVEVRLVLVEDELIDERRPWGKLGGLEVHRHPVYVLRRNKHMEWPTSGPKYVPYTFCKEIKHVKRPTSC